MGNSLDTEMGGTDHGFQRTHWTQILGAQTTDEAGRQAAVNDLFVAYWKPVYFYLRRKGYDNETAKDLVQGFFLEVVMGRELIQRADPAKGRFRTFLLTALDRYVASVNRAGRRAKRVPPGGLVHLDAINWDDVPEPHHVVTPDETFNYAWASALLDEVLKKLELECIETGKQTHWDVFCARALNPILKNEEPVAVADLCARYGIDSERKAWDMVSALKQRFRAILRFHVRLFVETEDEVDEEIGELLKIFSKKGAG